MRTIELFAFRFRSNVTGKWVKSRYKAERNVIEQRHPGAIVLEETREVREVEDNPGAYPSRAG